MTLRSTLDLDALLAQEDLNFLLTNRIPRRLATRFIGWFSQIEQPLVRDLSIGVWRLFSDLDLGEAKKTQLPQHARLLHPGAQAGRAADRSRSGRPGQPLRRHRRRLRHDRRHRAASRSRAFPTGWRICSATPRWCDATATAATSRLRLTSSMYHRFHAPHDCRVEQVTYISGDTWNVNPIALKRVEKLFCKNERAVMQHRARRRRPPVTLVPVAAILVASIRLHFLDVAARSQAPRAATSFPCDATFSKGEEMGWFQHGSTIIVFAPDGFTLCEGVREGATIRVGEPLMRLP